MPWIVRRMSSGVSVMSTPLPTAACTAPALAVSAASRHVTLIVSAVTPLAVAPPLSPEKATHGGE